MAVEDPGTLTVICDSCGDATEMDTTQYAGLLPSFGVEESTLEDNDWTMCEGEILCPKCSEEKPE